MKRSYEKYKSKQQNLKEEKLLEKLNGSVNSGADSSAQMPSAVVNGHNGHNGHNNPIWSQPNPDKAYSTTSSNLLSNMSADQGWASVRARYQLASSQLIPAGLKR